MRVGGGGERGHNHVKGKCEIIRDADAETMFHSATSRLQNQLY